MENERLTPFKVLELGSIDFAHLLAKRKGQPLNYHFLRYYWQQVRYTDVY